MRSLNFRLTILLVLVLITGLFMIAPQQPKVSLAQTTGPDVACIGSGVASYMNTVINAALGCASGPSNNIGIFTDGGGSATTYIRQVRPSMVVVFNNLDYASTVKQNSSSTMVVGRPWNGFDDSLDGIGQTRQKLEALMGQYPDVDVWQGYNEVLSKPNGGLGIQLDHDIQVVDAGAARNKRVCIGSFKEGWPTNIDSNFTTNYVQPLMAHIAATNMSGNTYLCVHEHESAKTDGGTWTFGARYNGRFTQLVAAGLNLPVLVTVAGYDSQAGPTTDHGTGWADTAQPGGAIPAQTYLNMLESYASDALSNGADGVAVFQAGIGGWGSYDISPLMNLSTGTCTGTINRIRFLSPAFNLTSPYLPGIISAMRAAGANFARLDGYAGNAYNTTGGTITGFLANARTVFSSNSLPVKPWFLTEIGMYDVNQGASRSDGLANLTQQVGLLRQDSGVSAALLFDSFGTNADPDFQYNRLSDSEIQTICGGSCGKIGMNFATFYGVAYPDGYQHAARLGMNFTLEIATNDAPTIADLINSLPSNITPIIRVGVGSDGGGFESAVAYGNFLSYLSTHVTRTVYAIAGPNEPETEMWATPNCDSNTIVAPPYFPTYYACGSEANPEYHSLRPYPASPCDNRVLQITQSCANDIIVRQSFEDINASDCSAPWNGNTKVCQGSNAINVGAQSYPITVDAGSAQLPIVGNTQNVPNEVNLGSPAQPVLTNQQRVNEYVSWYLNGIKPTASETRASADDLINYAGPIQKLTPEKGLRLKRRSPYEGASIGSTYHNEIIACTSGNRFVPCIAEFDYSDPAHPVAIPMGEIHRRDVMDSIPLEEDYPFFNSPLFPVLSFWPNYINWKNSLNGRLFNYLPLKTTEDRPGLLYLGIASTDHVSTRAEGGINDNRNAGDGTFTLATSGPGVSNVDVLYYAHMAETADLSRLLYGTYLPQGRTVGSVVPDTPYSMDYYDTQRCTQTGRANPGDNLWSQVTGQGFEVRAGQPETTIQNPPMIQTTLTQNNVAIECQFTTNPNAGCFNVCLNGCDGIRTNCGCQLGIVTAGNDLDYCKDEYAGGCMKVGTTNVPAASYTPVSVYAGTPRADDLYYRLLNGPYSIYKRIMPDDYIPTARKGEHFLDDPGVAVINYSTTAANTEILAGAPDGTRSGNEAELYFPHLGAIHDYFLRDMQTMLQPQGMGANSGFGPIIPTNPPNTNLNVAACTGACSTGGAAGLPACPSSCTNVNTADPNNQGLAGCVCAVENLLPYFGGDQNAATIASHICLRESGGNQTAFNNGCLDYLIGASLDYSVGLFQINMIAACEDTFTSYGFGPPPYCRIDGTLQEQVERRSRLAQCKADYSLASYNIEQAVILSQNGTDWHHWRTQNNTDQCGQPLQ